MTKYPKQLTYKEKRFYFFVPDSQGLRARSNRPIVYGFWGGQTFRKGYVAKQRMQPGSRN